MRISSYTDYSLRVLIHAAAKSPALVTIDEVAGAFRISKNHLMKVIHSLAKAGFLSTQRGRNGGFTLARPARDIRVSDVVRLTEQGAPLVECFDPATNKCIITPACKLKFILHDAEQAFYGILSQRTIADLFISPEAVLHHLGPDNVHDTSHLGSV